jgi:hypothetical protein
LPGSRASHSRIGLAGNSRPREEVTQ